MGWDGMANTKPRALTVNFSMALAPKDRKLIKRAAKILEQLDSVWARSALIEAANKIIGEAKAAK